MRRWFLILSLNAAAAVSAVMFGAVGWLGMRAQGAANDYLEWKAPDVPVPQRPNASVPKENQSWTKFAQEYENWDRERWSLHIRANSDAIFAFGRQPFFGYPRNSFNLHLYYWLLLPALLVLPALRARGLMRSRNAKRRGFEVAPKSQ